MRHAASTLLLAFSLFAQKENPAYAAIQDVEGLPRVLVIGDSISIGYTLPVRALMAGKANVHRIPENAAHSRNGVENLEKWIASDKRWDVIHVNFGLHDLKRMDDGLQQVSLADYETNLNKIFARLAKTGAKVVLATTTPVPYADMKVPRTDLDTVVYNKVARRVAEAHGATVLDLYAAALPKLGEIQLPANVHYNAEGYQFLARQVAECWLRLLK